MISFGISNSLSPIISKNFAERIETFLKYAFITMGITGVISSIVVWLAPEKIADIFLEQKDQESMTIILVFFSLVWPAFLCNGPNMVISSYFTAMHKPVQYGTIAFSRSLILPTLFIIVLPLFLGDSSIFLATPLAEIVTFVLALYSLKSTSPEKLIVER